MTSSRYPTLVDGDRVTIDFKSGGQMEVRRGTVVQTSSTQPHIAWVDWDDGRRWQMVGTAALRVEVESDA